jgi:Fe-S cluster assembly iron-binding protein IscA
MRPTDLDGWVYMFSIVKGMKEADIYISNGLEEKFKVECMFDSETQEVVEDTTLDYCREVGEDFVMGR